MLTFFCSYILPTSIQLLKIQIKLSQLSYQIKIEIQFYMSASRVIWYTVHVDQLIDIHHARKMVNVLNFSIKGSNKKTFVDQDNYPIYKRRNNGNVIEKNGCDTIYSTHIYTNNKRNRKLELINFFKNTFK